MPCGGFSVPCSGFASFPSVLRRHSLHFRPRSAVCSARSWCLVASGLRVDSVCGSTVIGLEFYPAEGGPPIAVPRMPARKAKTARKPGDGVTEDGKQKAKRVTTAQLSDSIQDLMSSLPALSGQIRKLSGRQKLLDTVAGPASCHALSQPLSNAMPCRGPVWLHPLS